METTKIQHLRLLCRVSVCTVYLQSIVFLPSHTHAPKEMITAKSGISRKTWSNFVSEERILPGGIFAMSSFFATTCRPKYMPYAASYVCQRLVITVERVVEKKRDHEQMYVELCVVCAFTWPKTPFNSQRRRRKKRIQLPAMQYFMVDSDENSENQ